MAIGVLHTGHISNNLAAHTLQILSCGSLTCCFEIVICTGFLSCKLHVSPWRHPFATERLAQPRMGRRSTYLTFLASSQPAAKKNKVKQHKCMCEHGRCKQQGWGHPRASSNVQKTKGRCMSADCAHLLRVRRRRACWRASCWALEPFGPMTAVNCLNGPMVC